MMTVVRVTMILSWIMSIVFIVEAYVSIHAMLVAGL
jgi:hypothetical protein